MVSFNPVLIIRAVTICLIVGVICIIIAASITIGVILIKMQDPQLVFKGALGIALERLLADNEVYRFYDKQATLLDLAQSLNEHFRRSNLSPTFVNFIVSKFTQQPVSIGSSKKRSSKYRSSIIVVEGIIYFTQNHIGEQILSAVQNYSRYVTLVTQDGEPSTALGKFSPSYSYATNTTADQITKFKAEKLNSIAINPDDDSVAFGSVIVFKDGLNSSSAVI